MADKLDWLNKHLVLIRYTALKDVMEKEGYKIRPDLEEYASGVSSAEEMVFKFAGLGRYKCAAELMAYMSHRRAAMWWGYRCVLSLQEELRQNPVVERDIADIGANFKVKVPDFAKTEPPKLDPEKEKREAEYHANMAEAQSALEKARAEIDPEILKLFDDGLQAGYDKFKSIHGISPLDLLKKLGERMALDPHPIDKNSPIFLEAAKIKAKLAAVQKETVDTIKSVLPPKVPAHEKKLRDNALSAVYSWVAAPDAENSQKCLNLGNECPDTPAGLLSLTAFWSYGDLMPLGEQSVPTPAGLAANGLNQVLLMCALHKGGTRKLKERYEEYFRLGIEVLTGADNWEASLAAEKAPHEELSAKNIAALNSAPPPQEPSAPPASGAPAYKRWKPENGGEGV